LKLYSDADVIVGLHGAGLTNAMLSRKGQSVTLTGRRSDGATMKTPSCAPTCTVACSCVYDGFCACAGVVVVELKSAYGSAEVYRKIAQARHGGYVMVPLHTPPDDVSGLEWLVSWWPACRTNESPSPSLGAGRAHGDARGGGPGRAVRGGHAGHGHGGLPQAPRPRLRLREGTRPGGRGGVCVRTRMLVCLSWATTA
jgi:hypothetical protein